MYNKYCAKLGNDEYIEKIKFYLDQEGGFIYFNYDTQDQLICIEDQINQLINKKFYEYKDRLIMDILDHWVVISVLN